VKQKQTAIDMLKMGISIQQIVSLTKWIDDNIKKLKNEIENQEFKKVTDKKKKRITMDMLKRGFGIQEIALLTNWIDEAIKKLKEVTMNQKFESVLDLEYQIVLNSESQQLKGENALVKGKPSYETFEKYINKLLLLSSSLLSPPSSSSSTLSPLSPLLSSSSSDKVGK
jgi:uncharacterized protein with GYD domain